VSALLSLLHSDIHLRTYCLALSTRWYYPTQIYSPAPYCLSGIIEALQAHPEEEEEEEEEGFTR
jgi:hypothetical protein